MVEFSNIIKVTTIASGQNQEYEFMADSFSYIPQLTENQAGNYWNCDKTIIIDKPSENIIKFFSVERSAIVTIRRSDRKSFNIGSTNIPARVQISSNLNTCNLIIKCKSLTDPLL